MSNHSQYIVVGRFGRPKGLAGLLYVDSYTDPPSNLFDYQPWQVRDLKKTGEQLKACHIVKKNLTGNRALVSIDGCQTCEQAQFYTNKSIHVHRSQLPEPPPGSYYYADLEGFTVYNQNSKQLGIVDHIFSNGAQDIIAIASPTHRKKFLLIPFLKQSIVQIDAIQKKILVDWHTDDAST